MNLLAKDMETRVFLLASIGSFLFVFFLVFIRTLIIPLLILLFVLLKLSFKKKKYLYWIVLLEFMIIPLFVGSFLSSDEESIGMFYFVYFFIIIYLVFSALLAIPITFFLKKYIKKTSPSPTSSEKNTTI